jgi:hypothetical protein
MEYLRKQFRNVYDISSMQGRPAAESGFRTKALRWPSKGTEEN